MLVLLESRKEKVAAQREFNRLAKAALGSSQRRRIVWRPSSREVDIAHDGAYWFVSVPPEQSQQTPRYWNSFGIYRANGDLQIAVEVNIPIASDERRVSGFFARDTVTDIVYLMHDGAVGGGRKGVGKTSFLAWSGDQLVPISDSEGDVRLGIIVAPLKARGIAGHISRFAQKVLDFKQAVKNGEVVSTSDTDKTKRTYDDYYREFSGKKKGQRATEFEYISRHGDIVHALREWRTRHAKPNERVVKNAYLDLGIAVSGSLTEIYEVKTNSERQSLYTAIGQIIVHDDAGTAEVQRYLVVPNGGSLPHDVEKALKSNRIKVIHFALKNDVVTITG